jgi:hypothetical protein
MTDTDALLKRFQPQLKYDSNEAFFADSAAEWTDNPGNVLKRPKSAAGPERVFAAASPQPGQSRLSLAFLGARYEGTDDAEATDVISDPTRNYGDQYVALRQKPGYKNRMYGHASKDSDGRLWLQYWFWYFYNDYNLAGRIGLHEGDWEMVQFRMLDFQPGEELTTAKPDLAVYAQHRHAQQASWNDVEKLAGSPDTAVVYVARGSHASYFRSGYHETEVWYDMADGKRRTPWLSLEIVGDDSPSWVAWPGRWGDTTARHPKWESPSPDGPAQHKQWDDPKQLLQGVHNYTTGQHRDHPDVKVTRSDRRLQVQYDFSKQREPPHNLIVTVNSTDDPLPPRTYTFTVEGTRKGKIETTLDLANNKRYDINVSTTDGQGRPSAAYPSELRPVGIIHTGVAVLHGLGRVVRSIRKTLGRD